MKRWKLDAPHAAAFIVVVLLAAAAILMLQGGREPGEQATPTPPPATEATPASPTSTTPTTTSKPGGTATTPPGFTPGRPSWLVDVTVPPFVELERLYQPIPVAVFTTTPIDPEAIAFYVNDSMGNLLPARVLDARYKGERQGLHVYTMLVHLSQGYYTPGNHTLYMVYEGVGAPVNLAILGALKPSPLEYHAAITPAGVLVEASNPSNMEAVVEEVGVANCAPPTRLQEAIPPQRGTAVMVPIPGQCTEAGVLTVYIKLRLGGTMYIDVIPARQPVKNP